MKKETWKLPKKTLEKIKEDNKNLKEKGLVADHSDLIKSVANDLNPPRGSISLSLFKLKTAMETNKNFNKL